MVLNSPNKRKWRRRGLILSLLIVLLPLLGLYLYGQLRTPGAMLTSENYTDRPIFSYWVNDNWGGNGGVTCCWRLDGPTAKVVWILSRTGEQARQGVKQERHEIELPMPPRGRDDRYLHVRFDPDNQVRLGWSPDLFSPFSPRPERAQNKEVDHE
ncbi:hypothetical protein ACIGFL_02650 [Pseudomonas sp. NPDC077649]|uniref:hypothetical protein n=1 Tax=Pseudomonas sp. NPDC077649 TaxID=3364423 RepID=UPI0037CAF127